MRSERCGATWGERGELSGPVARAPAGAEGFLLTARKSLLGDALWRWSGCAALLPPWSGRPKRPAAPITVSEGAELGARQVERVEASWPEGLAQCAAEQVLDSAGARDLGQTLVGGPAQVVPGAQLAPVLAAPGLKSRSLGLQIFRERSCPLNGTLPWPPCNSSLCCSPPSLPRELPISFLSL